MKRIIRNFCNLKHFQYRLVHSRGRQEVKKFYKGVSLTKSDDGFEVNLDRYKLRTPRGNVMVVPSEPLALAIVEEWRCQDQVVNKANMHLTSLANLCIDGRDFRDRDTVINGMLELLRTDTVCFRVDSPEDLVQMQNDSWNPVIHHFEKRFEVTIPVTRGLTLPAIPDDVIDSFKKYLQSFSEWSLIGYEQSVDCLKSFVIASSVVNKEVSIDHAVFLSNLESEYQQKAWGAVEWKHTIDEAQMKCSLAAALLFVHFNSHQYTIKQKKKGFEGLNL